MNHLIKIKHQIFKYMIPCDYIADFFYDICDYDEAKNTYIFSNISYKRAKFNNVIDEHMKILNFFYHESKKKYLQNGFTFKGLHTIIRQLCNLYNIKYEKTIKYMFGKYEIIYTIHMV